MNHPLQGFSIPPPAPDLRARVLTAAAAGAARPHWIDRLYEDLRLRRAFLVLLLGLAALLALDLAPRSSPVTIAPSIRWDEENPPAEDPGTTAAKQVRALAGELG